MLTRKNLFKIIESELIKKNWLKIFYNLKINLLSKCLTSASDQLGCSDQEQPELSLAECLQFQHTRTLWHSRTKVAISNSSLAADSTLRISFCLVQLSRLICTYITPIWLLLLSHLTRITTLETNRTKSDSSVPHNKFTSSSLRRRTMMAHQQCLTRISSML